jgi:AP-1 complex subunit beta-1
MSAPKAGGFFSATNKRGEINEWRQQLNHEKETVRKEAVKKVIAAMTVGKDVSMLFGDVVKCVQTNNIELKKLVYLYIMYYAKSQPDLAILAVNTFDQDSKHANPLIRGLAVRTMACIRVPKILEYLAEPLRKSIKDKDPYVRKTAAVAIAKLFDLNSEMAIEQGFVESLNELLTDENPMVVANAVAALAEISQTSPEVNVEFNEKTVKTLLAALNDCTEWGQIFILDSMVNYDPKSENEATTIAERVIPRLAHSNAAVVLSAAKVILKLLGFINNQTTVKGFVKKLAGPLVTLLNSEPEIQYVALRNIDLIVQKHTGILEKDVKVFFCKYNDPIYVKLEKLEIMIKLVSERNIDTVLSEFKEYATEVDVEFVRRSVRAIGRCAIKLERAAQRCINTLLELIETKVNYVVQEAVIVIKDIFRKYPNKYEAIIGTLCSNLDTLDEPEAKASMIWIIGEYADRIENATELVNLFADTFQDEAPQVQLQILTATVKLFLKRPTEAQELVKKVLTMSTDESDNPDLRDRGYIYWRLLSSNVQAAKNVILPADKPTITEDSSTISKQLLDELIPYISTLASVYQKPPELFVPDYKKKSKAVIQSIEKDDEEDIEVEREAVDLSQPVQTDEGIDDILGLGDFAPKPTTQPKPQPIVQHQQGGMLDFDDLLGGGQAAPKPQVVAPKVKKNLLLTAQKGNGLVINGVVTRKHGQIVYDFTLENQGSVQFNGFAAKFNKNTFGLGPSGPIQTRALAPGDKADGTLVLSVKGDYADKISSVLQVAVKINQADGGGPVVYFQDKLPVSVLYQEDGKLGPSQIQAAWGSIPDQPHVINFQGSSSNPEIVKQKLEARNLFFVTSNQVATQTGMYFSAKLPYKDSVISVLTEVVVFQGSNTIQVNTKASNNQFIPLIEEDIQQILSE